MNAAIVQRFLFINWKVILFIYIFTFNTVVTRVVCENIYIMFDDDFH